MPSTSTLPSDGWLIAPTIVSSVLLPEPDEAAERRDFGNTWHGLDRIAHVPVLKASQLGEIVLPGSIDERIFEDPADCGFIARQFNVHAMRHRGRMLLKYSRVRERAQ